MASYAKFWLAVLATVVSAIVAALTDGTITPVEWVMIAIAGVNAVAVVVVPNLPDGIAAYTKSVVAVLMAVLTALVGMITGFTPSDALTLIVIAPGSLA